MWIVNIFSILPKLIWKHASKTSFQSVCFLEATPYRNLRASISHHQMGSDHSFIAKDLVFDIIKCRVSLVIDCSIETMYYPFPSPGTSFPICKAKELIPTPPPVLHNRTFLHGGNIPYLLSNMVVTSPMWLLSISNVISATEKFNFINFIHCNWIATCNQWLPSGSAQI